MEPREIKRLVRLAADGEISAEESARLEQHLTAHPEDRAAISLERELRAVVGRVMNEPESAPAGLRDSIERAVAGEPQAPEMTGRIQPGLWRRPSAMAAGIVILVGVAVAWSIFSHGGVIRETQTPVQEHVGFNRQPTPGSRQLKFTTIEDAQAYLQSDKFGWDGEVPDLNSFGFDFLGSTRSHSNGEGGVRVFLRYASRTNAGDRLTICVERPLSFTEGRAAQILEGHAYRGSEIVSPDRQESECFLIWRSGGSIICLIPCDGEDRRELAVSIGMPDVEEEPHP